MANSKNSSITETEKAYPPSSPSTKLDFKTGWSYDEAPQDTGSIELKDSYNLFIGGEFIKPESKDYFATINPATEKRLSTVAEAGAADVDKAMQAARNA